MTFELHFSARFTADIGFMVIGMSDGSKGLACNPEAGWNRWRGRSFGAGTGSSW
ncbi:MAG: hypothetical protein JSV66_13180 [Trueperaceae bacterium]|nr:MAG: hypothetical protein JSV66_13180 [Trueperaceae bacterium]